jgi:hypothetical protein
MVAIERCEAAFPTADPLRVFRPNFNLELFLYEPSLGQT